MFIVNKACCKSASFFFFLSPTHYSLLISLACAMISLSQCVWGRQGLDQYVDAVSKVSVTAVTAGEILTSSTGRSWRRSRRGRRRDRFLRRKKNKTEREKGISVITLHFWTDSENLLLQKHSLGHHVKGKVMASFAPGLWLNQVTRNVSAFFFLSFPTFKKNAVEVTGVHYTDALSHRVFAPVTLNLIRKVKLILLVHFLWFP